MNTPPESGIRIPPPELHALVATLFEKAGASRVHADLMAFLLVQTDLRGTFSHGTRHCPSYLRLMLEGRVNPRPNIHVVSQTATTRVLDGDGGMGHLPCYQGTQWAIARAKESGTAAVTTRNHYHFGAASKYSWLALEHDCIALAISSHRYPLDPEQTVLGASGGSPLSFAIPAGQQPPIAPDMALQFLPWDPELFAQYPGAYFKGLGLAATAQALGGILAGIYRPECQSPPSRWESNQGAFIAVFDIGRFMPVDEFKSEMDRYVGQARGMQPLPGCDRAELAGGPERARERDYDRNGIPVSPEHQKALEVIAAELGVETPFDRYEHTRFGA